MNNREMIRLKTGLLDKNGQEICHLDRVSLAGNITSDDSLGELPNGWSFTESDVYTVILDSKLRMQTRYPLQP